MVKLSYSMVYIGTTGVIFLVSFFLPDMKGATADVRLTDPAKATLDYITEMAKLVGSLNTALFAACGALAIKGRDWSAHWTDADGYMIILALVAGSTCYYGTYLAQTAIIEMVYHGAIDPFSVRLSTALGMQYYALLLGVFLVGLVFARMLAARRQGD